MSVKGVKLKSESFFSISPDVWELWRKNLRGRFCPSPGPDRVKTFSRRTKSRTRQDLGLSQDQDNEITLIGWYSVALQIYCRPISYFLTSKQEAVWCIMAAEYVKGYTNLFKLKHLVIWWNKPGI